MIWVFAPQPGTLHLAAQAQSEEEYAELLALPEILFDGQRAYVVPEGCDHASLFVRFRMEVPFRMPATVIRFELAAVAGRIAATGWYVLDGALYRARLRAPDEVVLDRVYASEPTATYEGRTAPSLTPEEVTA